jgi:hypothetical protein
MIYALKMLSVSMDCCGIGESPSQKFNQFWLSKGRSVQKDI